ncbi:MAG: signal peptide peptidase SppA [Planctomycetes bacterium]|nr:signal peptide peptidase SppA [Planctomycetota bacterium]
MNLEQNNNLSQQPSKKRTFWKILRSFFLTISAMANIVILVVVIGIISLFATVIFTAGQKDAFTEKVIQSGSRTNKIVVINLEGIIDSKQSLNMYNQLKLARNDEHIKAIIIRTNSPGGTISASDQIYNEILKCRNQANIPVVAFMQGVAASGAYYTSVGCDKIIAEPTAITGSIGVIMGHFVIQELLEEKLGIQPVIIKSGEKKDWPNPFQEITEEQEEYIQKKLIVPFYERFTQIIAHGRDSLTIDDINRLADGSIYNADEALDEKLIDQIGYLDDAIELAKSLAEIEDAQVIEYQRPFSFTSLLDAKTKTLLKIDRTTLYELTTPQLLYLWTLQN